MGSRVGFIPPVMVTEEWDEMERARRMGAHWRPTYSRERPAADTESGGSRWI